MQAMDSSHQPPPSHPALKPSWRDFAPRLSAASRGWRRAYDAAMAAHGLSNATALPLMMLARYGDGIPQKDLADLVGVEGPTIVRVVDGLEQEGLIRRDADAADRRVKLIRLTDAGRAVAAEAETAASALRARLLGDLPPEHVDIALGVLDGILEKLPRD
ncbi:MarR family transcriptional regulator, transcriptional regulator for hemolysin [Pseudoxanthobacter soli DSM 19599]|uniref:MarR family transcriptional regulator, transcriptional regulator for hemolysin n=2 Tax=Pseudoxanthobacter TaxID=433838 RepID=A0A1M7ZP66_9HYPH|nr:MarR family transcriptional regulator, transcriptional regulator for hemolysin [Pseudoxanthobacter soli DSM 19599]